MKLRDIDALVHEIFFGLPKEKEPALYTTTWDNCGEIAKAMHVEWPDFSITGTAELLWRVSWGFEDGHWNKIDATTCPLALSLACLASKKYFIEPPYEPQVNNVQKT